MISLHISIIRYDKRQFNLAIDLTDMTHEPTYLQKPNHSLKATDHGKINAILKGRHGHKSACRKTFPIGQNTILLGLHVDAFVQGLVTGQ